VSLVSVVIPCRNYGRFLGDAIDSVLAQDHREVEVIVVDYGSTDETSDVLARYPQVRHLKGANHGVAVARNVGLEAGRGAFVVFLDADDQLVPDAISTSLACLRTRPASAFAYGHERWVDASGTPLAPKRPPECLDEDPYSYMLRTNHPLRAPGAMLYRRDVLERVGGYTPGSDGCADLDLNLRLVREHPICCNDRVVLVTRRHETNMTRIRAHMLSRAVAAQRSQRAYVARHPIYERDYRTGLRLARSYWGALVANDIVSKAAARDVASALSDLGTLIRYDPRGAAALPTLIGRRLILRLRRGST